MDSDTPPPRKRLAPILRLVVLFVLLACGFMGYTRYFVNQRLPEQQSNEMYDARLQNLENTVLQQEKRLSAVEDTAQKLASAPPPASSSSPATTSPATAAPTGAEDARITALEQEITALKASAPQQDPEKIRQSILLLSALHHLSDKVLSGKPFAVELAAFQEQMGGDNASGSPLSTLAPYADSGVPTFTTLLGSFDQSVEGLNAAEAVPPENADFWARFKYNLAHLITVRRISDANKGNSISATVGRAQAHLEKGEIEAAMTEIKQLPDSARGNFTAWSDDAQTVLNTPSLIDQLEEQVMRKAFRADSLPATPRSAPDEAPPSPAPATPPADSTPTAPKP
jgi:hypothetical protein